MPSYYSLSHNYFLFALSFSSSRTFDLHFSRHILLVIDITEFQMFCVCLYNLELLGLFFKNAKTPSLFLSCRIKPIYLSYGDLENYSTSRSPWSLTWQVLWWKIPKHWPPLAGLHNALGKRVLWSSRGVSRIGRIGKLNFKHIPIKPNCNWKFILAEDIYVAISKTVTSIINLL